MTARGGFTLVEVLVVMATMVILFGMLFVPISSSIDMARAGQSRVQMQQQSQMAMQRINRGISGAQSVWLPEYIPIENTPGDPADDTYLINYSNITFQPPGYIRPPGQDQPVVRYAVMIRKPDPDPVQYPGEFQEVEIPPGSGDWYWIWNRPSAPPDIDNPFVLYRLEGIMKSIDGRNYFGADADVDGDGTPEFVIGLWSSRNALTPQRNADIPVTRTICLDAAGYLVLPPSPPAEPGQLWAKGYVNHDDRVAVFGAAGVKLIYIHDGVTFGPLRVENERLFDAGSGDTTEFRAEYGYWLGLSNNGGYTLADVTWDFYDVSPSFPALVNSSELRPRIVVRRDGYGGDGIDGSYKEWCLLDTDELDRDPPNPAVQPAPSDVGGVVVDNMFGISWNSDQGTVILDSAAGLAAGLAIVDFDAGAANNLTTPPSPDEVWDFAASGYGTVIRADDGVYGEDIADTTLAAAASAGSSSIEVDDASVFLAGDDIRIVDADGTNRDDVTIASTDTVADPNTITFAPGLGNSYDVGDLVRQTGGPPPYYRRAYSIYQITPLIEAVSIADKMIIPGSIDVTVYGIHSTLGARSRTYAGILFPSPGSQDDITEGQFYYEPVAAGDYTSVNIYFGNGVIGRPPNPDNPATYNGDPLWTAATLTAFWIEISYDVRRNFSTSSPTLQNDQIDVSYSTRAIYNVSLELLPWRYYQDNDNDHIWTPYQHTKGVHLQGHIRIAALGG